MKKFKQDERMFLVCPWCPEGAVTVLIENCPHNPFKLMHRIKELENEVHQNDRAARILTDLKDILSEL